MESFAEGKADASRIIVAFKLGDDQAFQKIFTEYYQPLLHFAEKITNQREEAEDIVLECFHKLFKLNEKFDTINNIRAFLYISIRNTCLNYLKYKQQQTKKRNDFIRQTELLTEDHPQKYERKELSKTLNLLVEKLPNKCKRILQLYIDGHKTYEIAVALNIEIVTVRSHLRYGRKLLKKYFNEQTELNQ